MTTGAPWLEIDRRRAIRAPINPLDKATIISIYPKPIHEVKYTIQPGVFDLPAGRYENPSVLTIGPSSWWKDVDAGQPLLEIPVSSILVADSVVKDYCNGLLACDMAGAMPGIFWLSGVVSALELQTKHQTDLDIAREKQKNWYQALVKMADTLWARSPGNPLVVSDDMRLAARELQMEKEWIKDFQSMELINCKACGTRVKPGYPVCPNCHHVVDEKLYKSLNLQKAG